MNQLPVLTKPNASDPRFPKPRGEQAPADRVRERMLAGVLRCDRGGCNTRIHVNLPEAKREKNAIDHGFVRGEGLKDHQLYCSRRCRDMDAPAVARVGDPCRRPHCLQEGLSIGQCYCKPEIGGAGPQCPITRVTVRDNVDRQGVNHRAIICDRWSCQEKQYVDPKTTPERICQIAFTAGFRQRHYGTCCSEQCARLLGRDVAAGRQPPVTMQDANTTTVTTVPPDAAPAAAAAVAPEPRPAPPPRGNWGIWCYERDAYYPNDSQPWSGDQAQAIRSVEHMRMQAIADGQNMTFAPREFGSAAAPARPLSRRERRAAAAAKAAPIASKE